MEHYYNNLFAQVYDAGTYDGSTYGSATSSGSGNSGSSSGGILTNTGFDILLIVTIACVLTFTAIMTNFFRRSSKNQTPHSH